MKTLNPPMPAEARAVEFDLDRASVRELNAALHALPAGATDVFEVGNPRGRHAIAAGLRVPATVTVHGHVGYYAAGMNQLATVNVHGNAGTGVAENMMSGTVRVRGSASQSAGATAHGGLLVIGGDASSRCGIALKGADVVVGGSVGHACGFMAQAGRIVVCGNAGESLGDSLYEAEIFVRGTVASLGADCEERAMDAATRDGLATLLEQAGVDADAAAFRRYGSARRLYHFNVDHAGSYG